MDFQTAFSQLMIQEDGENWYQAGLDNVANDKGGLTKWGVTSGTWADWCSTYGLQNSGVADMTLEQAQQIAYQWYWLAAGCDKMPNGLDYALFQAAYVSGPVTMVKRLQSVLGVTQDGKVGPETLGAIASRDTNSVIAGFLADQVSYDQMIVQKDPTQQGFLQGWENRAQNAWNFIQSHLEQTGGAFIFMLAAGAAVAFITLKSKPKTPASGAK